METRETTTTEVKIYKLILNPMRGHTEGADMVAIAYDKNKLINWYKSQFAPEVWEDYGENSFPSKGDMHGYHNDNHCWNKVFIKGSQLEWYNPINLFDVNSMEGVGYGHGISEEWVETEVLENFLSKPHNSVNLLNE